MQFRVRDAPEWFNDHLLSNYVNELHRVQETLKPEPGYTNLEFRQMACEFFKEKGFDVWLDEEGHLWFDIDANSPQWTFEILKG